MVVANTLACSGCNFLRSASGVNVAPNSDVGVDGMMSTLAHEIVETLSDPISNVHNQRAWQDSKGNENADKCHTNFGDTETASNGAKFNMLIGPYRYLIQKNWNAQTQRCESFT